MSSTFTLARPYAKGAFKAAKEANALSVWDKALQHLAQMLEQKTVYDVVENPMIPKQDIIKFLMDAAEIENAEIKNFLNLLAQYHRLTLLPEIHALFVAMRHDDEKVLDGELIVPIAISDDTVALLTQRLAQRYQRQVRLQTRIDPSLIGGAMIRIGNEVIDASLKSKINELTKHLLT